MFYNLFVPLNSESQWNNHSFPTGKNWWPFFLLTPPRGSNSQPFRFTNGAYEYMSLTLCLIELGGLWGSKIGGVLHAHFLAMIPNQSVLHKCNFAYKLGVRYPDVSNWIRLKSDGKDHSERHKLNKKNVPDASFARTPWVLILLQSDAKWIVCSERLRTASQSASWPSHWQTLRSLPARSNTESNLSLSFLNAGVFSVDRLRRVRERREFGGWLYTGEINEWREKHIEYNSQSKCDRLGYCENRLIIMEGKY